MEVMEETQNESENKNRSQSSHKNKKGSIAWLRSEPMTLCQVFFQSESIYACVNLLGEIGLTQFRDLNPNVNAFQRKFVNELRRCDEMERQLNFFEREILKDNIPLLDYDEEPEAPIPKDISKLEAQFEKLEYDLVGVNTNSESLKKNFLEFTELRHILKKTGQFFEEAQEEGTTQKEIRRLSIVDPKLMRRFSAVGLPEIPLDPVADINFIAGTIPRQKLMSFERMVWRVCRGNIFLRSVDIDEKIEDPKTGEMLSKCIFIIVFQGEHLKIKCKKICEGFHTILYPCPERASERNDMHAGVVNRIEDLEVVMKQTSEHRSRMLVAIAKNLMKWKVMVRKMKAIYETMNLFSFDVTAKCLIAECWCPTTQISTIQEALVKGQKISESSVPSVLTRLVTKEEPPTYNITNKFTKGFQAIVDAYGVGNYGEVNPAPFTIVTFPFLYGVMFGDAGHGLIMALFALWMVLQEKSLSKKNWGEIWDTFFNGRYIILLMGFFSIYTGFIYNDVFSKSMNIFGSAFNPPNITRNYDAHTGNFTYYYVDKHLVLDPQENMDEDPYIFGIDPIWQISTSKILFLNSYKMKVSVILGVGQMLFGVFLSIINHWHFKNWINIICEFIPQVIFLLSIFGYMNFMIVYKWFMYKSKDSSCAPSVLITLINMFLMKQTTDEDPCYLSPMFTGQSTAQMVLLAAAVVSIPWMLFIKPFYLNYKYGKKANYIVTEQSYHNVNEIEMSSTGNNSDKEIKIEIYDRDKNGGPSQDHGGGGHGGHGGHGDGEFDFSDTFILQAIHTIEYCLGSISHTASYLRLWALSLAHSQLSEVLWNMVFINAFTEIGEGMVKIIIMSILLFAIFAIWASLTIFILLLMEGLSAFLHALRLHWVEFQSKFYVGAGYAFQPFSFKTTIAELIRPKE